MDITTTKRLNNGVEIPRLGLGVFRAENDEAEQSVMAALRAGYRHIDTAAIYGNEEGVGRGIKNSGIKREEIFVTTKLWNDDMRQGRQEAACEESLRKLGMDYVDLYLIHWPVAEKIQQSWKVMEKLYKEGHVRAIGVSNFLQHHVDLLMEVAEVTPAVNQSECHPYLNQKELREASAKMGIAFEAYSPLGGMGKGSLVQLPLLVEIGKKYGKTAAQVILRWDLQSDIITIPKSVHESRIKENADLYGFALSAEDMAAIDALNKDQRVGSHPDHFTF